MAKVKYTVKENTKTGTHSWYAVPVFNGTLSFSELCEEACSDSTSKGGLGFICEKQSSKLKTGIYNTNQLAGINN